MDTITSCRETNCIIFNRIVVGSQSKEDICYQLVMISQHVYMVHGLSHHK